MGVIIIDGSTVRSFVNNESHFTTSVDAQFSALDANNDGVLSRSEMRKAFDSMRLLETHFGVDIKTPPEELTKIYDAVFSGFDEDRNGTVDRQEFRAKMRKILLAVADGLGSSPIQMAVEEDDQSFLKKAADLDAKKIGDGV